MKKKSHVKLKNNKKQKVMVSKGQIAAIVIIIIAVIGAVVLITMTNIFGGEACPICNCPTCPSLASPPPLIGTIPAAKTPTPSTCVPGCTTDAGKRYVGAASENIDGPGGLRLDNADQCKAKCQANPKCVQYVYYKPNKLCYLQTVVHPDPPINDTNFTSGYCKTC